MRFYLDVFLKGVLVSKVRMNYPLYISNAVKKLNSYACILSELEHVDNSSAKTRIASINSCISNLTDEIESLIECHYREDYELSYTEKEQLEYLKMFILCYIFYSIYYKPMSEIVR
jgi:hypothetical protein